MEYCKPIMENLPGGYAYYKIIINENGEPCDYEFIFVNMAFENLTGLKRTHILNKKISDILPEIKEDEIEKINIYGNVAMNGIAKEYEHYSLKLNRFYKVNVFSPQKYYFITHFTDITTEKNQLLELDNFFKVGLDLLCISDFDGNFIKINNEWENVLGYKKEKIEGRNSLDFIHPEDFNATIEQISILEKDEKVLNFTNRYICSDGSMRYLEWKAQSNRGLIFASARDITEKNKTEEAYIEKCDSLDTLFTTMTEIVVWHELIFDKQGNPINYRITAVNDAFEINLGISKEFAIGKLATDVYQTLEPPYLSEFSKTAVTGKQCNFKTYYPDMKKYFSISVVSPGKNRFATITTDITDIKQAQNMIEDKNKELEQIVYVASHDLRSPLVNVDGYSRELESSLKDIISIIEKDEASKEKAFEYIKNEFIDMQNSLNHIKTSTKQLDKLLKGLLKFSRLGREGLEISQLNMNSLIKEVCMNLEYQEKQLSVSLNICELPPCLGDYVQITQVFTNIISNAYKYLDENRLGIIKIYGEITNGESIYCVEDNGIGIDERYFDNIFKIFHRLNPNDTGGEGLGLTIVKQILNRMGARINVESKLGEGSKFYVHLPTVKKVK